VVAALAASAADVLPGVAMTVTRRRTRSAANAGKRSFWPSAAQRYSMATFWPSTNPNCLSPSRNAASMSAKPSDDWACRYPITGIAGCCPRAASGQRLDDVAAVPPSAAMNARRDAEKSLDDAPSTDPSGVIGSLPGWLPACTYGMQPALQLCGMIAPHSKAPVYDVGHTAAIPKTSPLARCEFATIRERLIKIGARVPSARLRPPRRRTCSRSSR
jgi:hypothetical protein